MYTFTCDICGREFQTKRKARRHVCYDTHYMTCVVCGNKYEVSRKDLLAGDYRTTCSESCRYKLVGSKAIERYKDHGDEIRAKSVKTCLERYGTENPSQSDVIKDKYRNTMMSRYGVAHPLQSDKIRARVKETCIRRYGVSNAWNKPEVREKALSSLYEIDSQGVRHRKKEIQEKIESTCLDKYGTKNPFSSSEVRERARLTFQKKYGTDSYMETSDFVNTSRCRMKELYGVESPLQSRVLHDKFINTMNRRYGRSYGSQVHLDDEHWETWVEFKEDPEKVICLAFGEGYRPTFHQLSKLLGVDETWVSYTLGKCGKLNLIQYSKSNVENDVHDFISSVDSTVKVVRGTKSVIKPYELDIYLPDFNFAIEVNPTVTHNSSFGFNKHHKSDPLPPSYHSMKTRMCEEQGIHLLHIFGYDWSYKKDIIKSIILSNINHYSTKIYARKCRVDTVNSKTARNFLNINHLQGYVNSSYRYGLFYKGELVSLMCFCKPRKTMGYKVSSSNEGTYELVRFCNKLNTQVTGAASRLFKHFLQDVSCERVISYSDKAHFSGKLYSSIGFVKDHDIQPGYVWVRQRDDVPFHRINTQKRNLKKFLNDESIDLSLTEKQIMEEHGYVQVYDSGKVAWLYER